MMEILVTGASGQVGRHVVAALRAAGRRPRVLLRPGTAPGGSARAAAAVLDGLDVRRGDFDDPPSLDAALDGVDRLLLVCAPTAELADREQRAIEAARRSRVGLVVKMSILDAARADGDTGGFGGLHARAEATLAEAGLPHVVLRPNYFMQNVVGAWDGAATAGVYEDAAAGARLSMVDLRDVGEAAAAVLTAPPPRAPAVHTLTGPEALGGDDVARLLAVALGRDVRAVDLDLAALGVRLRGFGLSPWFSDAIVALYRDYHASGAHGPAAAITADVQRLTGHPPRSLGALLAEVAAGRSSPAEGGRA
jgi:uncharacterized protein YbjT (DUF2867 family)